MDVSLVRIYNIYGLVCLDENRTANFVAMQMTTGASYDCASIRLMCLDMKERRSSVKW